MERTAEQHQQPGLRCAYCHDEAGDEAESSECADCGTVVHDECLATLDRCPTYGCASLGELSLGTSARVPEADERQPHPTPLTPGGFLIAVPGLFLALAAALSVKGHGLSWAFVLAVAPFVVLLAAQQLGRDVERLLGPKRARTLSVLLGLALILAAALALWGWPIPLGLTVGPEPTVHDLLNERIDTGGR